MYLPQGPTAIQQSPVQARDQVEKLSIATRLWQGGMANVIIDVQRGVRLPVGRASQAQQTGLEAVAKGWQELIEITEIIGKAVQKFLLIGTLGQGVEVDPANVHGGFPVLGKQEAGVHDIQFFHRLKPTSAIIVFLPTKAKAFACRAAGLSLYPKNYRVDCAPFYPGMPVRGSAYHVTTYEKATLPSYIHTPQ